MDADIRLYRIDRTNGIGIFYEFFPGTEEHKRKIELSLNNLSGREYECQNFKIESNGRVVYNGVAYQNLVDLFNGIPEHKRISKLQKEGEIALKTSMKIMMDAARSNGSVRTVSTYCKHEIHSMVQGADRNGENGILMILVPEDVVSISDVMCRINGSSPSSLSGEKRTYEEVVFIGGGKKLTSIGNILCGVNTKRIDMDNLDYSNVVEINSMYNGACIDELDLSWTNKCKIKSMNYTFMNYRGKEIDINQLNIEHLSSAMYVFAFTKAELRGMEKFKDIKWCMIQGMFYGYQNKNAALDLSYWHTEKITSIREMFRMCEVREIDVSGWCTDNVNEASDAFSSVMASIIGIEGYDKKAWNLYNLVRASKMFCDAMLGNETSIKIKSNWTKMRECEQMFDGASLEVLDVSEMKYASEGAGCGKMFNDLRVTDLILPRVDSGLGPFTKQLVLKIQAAIYTSLKK